jgi:hypothetical protein
MHWIALTRTGTLFFPLINLALFKLRDGPLLLQLILNLLLEDVSGNHLSEKRLVVGAAIS